MAIRPNPAFEGFTKPKKVAYSSACLHLIG